MDENMDENKDENMEENIGFQYFTNPEGFIYVNYSWPNG